MTNSKLASLFLFSTLLCAVACDSTPLIDRVQALNESTVDYECACRTSDPEAIAACVTESEVPDSWYACVGAAIDAASSSDESAIDCRLTQIETLTDCRTMLACDGDRSACDEVERMLTECPDTSDDFDRVVDACED